MKTPLIYLLISLLACGCVNGEYRTWKRADGTEAMLQLEGKSGEGDQMKATFRLKNGKLVSFPVAQLSAEDAKFVRDWKGPRRKGESVYDDFLKDNLVILKGDSFESYNMRNRPAKYYMFFYSASWCGPCQQFTPYLVEFYTKHASKRRDFEIILVSGDREESDMKKYAKAKQMAWPHLKLSKVPSFKKQFPQPVRGFPALVLTDLDGNVLKSSYEGGVNIGPPAVMNHLQGLLK